MIHTIRVPYSYDVMWASKKATALSKQINKTYLPTIFVGLGCAAMQWALEVNRVYTFIVIWNMVIVSTIIFFMRKKIVNFVAKHDKEYIHTLMYLTTLNESELKEYKAKFEAEYKDNGHIALMGEPIFWFYFLPCLLECCVAFIIMN